MDFIRRHWIAYLIAALIALGLGGLGAYVIGIKASTPSDMRAENIKAEQKNAELSTMMENESESSSSSGTSDSGSTAE